MVPAFPGAGEGAGEAGVPVIRILGRKSAAGGNPLNPDAWDPCFWGFLGLFWGFFGALGLFGALWRIFSGNPLYFIRSKIRPNIRKIRNFGSGIRKIRIHPLVGTPVGLISRSGCDFMVRV